MENLKCILLMKEANLKGYTLSSLTVEKSQSYGDNKRISGFQELEKKKG